MRKLSEALGQDRWVQIQRSHLKEQIRNCSIDDVTCGELDLIAELFGISSISLMVWKFFEREKITKEEIHELASNVIEGYPHNLDENLKPKLVIDSNEIINGSPFDEDLNKVPKRD